MKITIIGGGGVRVPLLVNGLTQSDLPIDDIALFDVDAERAAAIAPLAARFARTARLRVESSVEQAIRGASFVIISLRVGGSERRARDEHIALAHGVIGQETVGAAGFAMAFRTVPAVVGYARDVERFAPDAWIVNFSNPVGITSQAVTAASGSRVVGVCDTPTELFEEIAHAIERPSGECDFDYFGLNHLGWVREVYHNGTPQLSRLWNDPQRLERLYRANLFDPIQLCARRLLPTEYVFYYECRDHALRNMVNAGQSRGGVVDDLNRRLFVDLRDSSNDPVQVYERYLAARDAGYMQIESGAPEPLVRSPWAALTGYDKIAVQTIRAIHGDSQESIPLNVVNGRAIEDLEPADVVEVPCNVGAQGARPRRVGQLPDVVADLVRQVKRYERLTVAAALSQDRRAAVQALAANPLVPDAETAQQLADALL